MLLLLVVGRAHASTDINGLFDARSTALGGTGAGYLDSAGAIPTNPALLDQIGKLTVTLDVFYIRSQPQAPYKVYHLDANGQRYASYDTIRSEPTGAPLPFLGAAYRLADRVVVGAAVYPVIGQGASAKFRPAPDELPNLVASNQVAMGLIEMGVPVSLRLLDNLAVALMWRGTYMTQSLNVPVPNKAYPGVLINTTGTEVSNGDIQVTGFNATGFQLGVFYKPVPALRLGLTYRSKVIVDGSGTTTSKNPLNGAPIVLDTQQGYTNPHAFRAGAALSVLDDKVLFVADFKYLMYAEAFKQLKVVTTPMNGKPMINYQPAYWKDSISLGLGAEVKAGDMLHFRAGYNMTTSATTEKYAISYMAPPGVAHLVSGGIGIKLLDCLNMDIAAAYVVLASTITEATEYNAGVGTYASHGFELAQSFTLHL